MSKIFPSKLLGDVKNLPNHVKKINRFRFCSIATWNNGQWTDESLEFEWVVLNPLYGN